jgi:hypothetical protein
MIFDPHSPNYDAKNLKEEWWLGFQRDPETKALAKEIKNIFERALIARVTYETLDTLGMNVLFKVAEPAVILQNLHFHIWTAIAICLLSHGRCESFDELQIMRFSKSPFDNEPMYGDNIKYVPCPERVWDMPVFKGEEVVKPEQQDLFGDF